MIPVPKVSDADVAFPARGDEITPPMEEIPDEYKKRGSKGSRLFADWFSRQVDWETLGLLPKEGVDAREAWRALQVIAGTFNTKHERKTAAMAYLLHEWFVDFAWTRTDGTRVPFEDGDFDKEWLDAQKR